MRRQKPCLLFRTTCSQVLQTKLFEFLIYAKEEQRLCNFPLGDLFSQPSAHPGTARQELDFIEPLRSPNSLWSSGLWWSREPFWNCSWNWAPLSGKCSGWWTGKLFSPLAFFPSFISSLLTYLVPSFLLPPFSLKEIVLQMRKRGDNSEIRKKELCKDFCERGTAQVMQWVRILKWNLCFYRKSKEKHSAFNALSTPSDLFLV